MMMSRALSDGARLFQCIRTLEDTGVLKGALPISEMQAWPPVAQQYVPDLLMTSGLKPHPARDR
jgi:hypothetical protein